MSTAMTPENGEDNRRYFVSMRRDGLPRMRGVSGTVVVARVVGLIAVATAVAASSGGFVGIDIAPPESPLVGFTRPLEYKDYVLYDGKSRSDVVFLTTGVRMSAAWQGEVRAAVVDRETRKDIPHLWLEVGYKGKVVTFLGEDQRQEVVQVLVPQEMLKNGIAAMIASEGFRPAALRVQDNNRPPRSLPPDQWEWAQEQYPALMMIGGLTRKSLSLKGSSDETTELGTIPSQVYDFSRSNTVRFGSGKTEYEWTTDGEVYASDTVPFGPVRLNLEVTYILRRALPGASADVPREYEPIRKIQMTGEWRLKKMGNDAQPWMPPMAPPAKK
jgi:hypothetical protein